MYLFFTYTVFVAGRKEEDTIKTDLYVYGASGGAWIGSEFTLDINITTSAFRLASSQGTRLAYTTPPRLYVPFVVMLGFAR